MTWKLADALTTLRQQVNIKWPARSRVADGTIGDAAHTARTSDHNPWIQYKGFGIVSGLDITHDPSKGPDSQALADMLVASRDTRIKYIISRKKIISGDAGPQPWVWRPYTGKNAHDHHVHISVKSDPEHFTSTKPWSLGEYARPVVSLPPPPAKPMLRRGAKSDAVKELQRGLGLQDDGVFGPVTDRAVREFQEKNGLVVDGVAGSQVWTIILKGK